LDNIFTNNGTPSTPEVRNYLYMHIPLISGNEIEDLTPYPVMS
jgi:hypothetical protein